MAYGRKKLDDRYQFQPFYIKCARWLRWMPFYYFVAAKKWVKNTTYKKDKRYFSIKEIFSVHRGIAQCKMKHYYTTDEAFNDIRGKLGLTDEKTEDNQSEES